MVMVMTIPADRLRPAHRPSFIGELGAAWRRHLERRSRILALRRAGRLGPRLLADMGIDPETVRAVSDGWDGLLPNGYLVRRR
jgi:uncharacterized protein YjiS (DUF1127 family)